MNNNKINQLIKHLNDSESQEEANNILHVFVKLIESEKYSSITLEAISKRLRLPNDALIDISLLLDAVSPIGNTVLYESLSERYLNQNGTALHSILSNTKGVHWVRKNLLSNNPLKMLANINYSNDVINIIYNKMMAGNYSIEDAVHADIVKYGISLFGIKRTCALLGTFNCSHHPIDAIEQYNDMDYIHQHTFSVLDAFRLLDSDANVDRINITGSMLNSIGQEGIAAALPHIRNKEECKLLLSLFNTSAFECLNMTEDSDIRTIILECFA